MTWAVPGAQCDCINDEWDEGLALPPTWMPPSRVPMINELLTIKEVIIDHPWKRQIKGRVTLTFVELGTDDCYAITHFAEPAALEPADPDNLDYGSVYDG